MHYRSTRDANTSPALLTFEETVLAGLAPDGGLYIPSTLPQLPADFLATWSQLDFGALCYRLFRLFIDRAEVSDEDLVRLVDKSYASFTHPAVTPVVRMGCGDRRGGDAVRDSGVVDGCDNNMRDDEHEGTPILLLELFHGPTFAFKDVALQFLGNLFEYFLERKNAAAASAGGAAPAAHHKITVVGATSGDTGGAAIYGLRGKQNVQLFILHPHKRVSLIQEAQMTSVLDANVHNIAVDGTFDDCQDAVKALFRDEQFRNDYQLGAINSINWARILAQISYYFHSYFQTCRMLQLNPAERPRFQYVVPTGNFGDVLAGHYARMLGLPIHQLVIATNENDILNRFFRTGVYERKGVLPTLAPAMDIQISSNFERYLWYLVHKWRALNFDAESEAMRVAATSQTVRQWMEQVSTAGRMSVLEEMAKDGRASIFDLARGDFTSMRVSNEEILNTIQKYHHGRDTGASVRVVQKMTLDPHTAIGVKAAEELHDETLDATICLATAHPSKFLSAVHKAIASVDSGESETNNAGDCSLDADIERRILEQAAHGKAPFDIPQPFIGILDRQKRCLRSGPEPAAIKQLIIETLAGCHGE